MLSAEHSAYLVSQRLLCLVALDTIMLGSKAMLDQPQHYKAAIALQRCCQKHTPQIEHPLEPAVLQQQGPALLCVWYQWRTLCLQDLPQGLCSVE